MVSADFAGCYVYGHLDNNGELFYIGKGTHTRRSATTGRSKKWKERAKDGFTYKIFAKNLLPHESEILEKHLISEYASQIVNKLDNSTVLGIKYEDVASRLVYDTSSPSFLRWTCANGKNVIKDAPAGCLNKQTGYYVVRLGDKLYQAHRLVWLLDKKVMDRNLVVDHIDCIKTNNSISNLRQVSKSANAYNRKENNQNTGVYWQKNKNGKAAITYLILNEKRKAKSFSVAKYGEDLAWSKACEARAENQKIMRKFYGI